MSHYQNYSQLMKEQDLLIEIGQMENMVYGAMI